MASLSVLICTFNRHEVLGQALDALLLGTSELPDQVVVVNGGDERADEVVTRARSESPVEIVLLKTVNKNLAANRNVGLPHCTGDIVAMTDDDAMVFPDWVTQLKRLHRDHPEAGAVGGMVLGSNPEKLIVKVADAMTFPRWPGECYVRTLPGVNISYRKDVLRMIGPQDEILFRGEDVDFNWRLLSLGKKILYSPDVKVYHHHRPTFGGLVHQQYMYGRAYVLVRRKHPDMYSILPKAPWSMMEIARGMKFLAATVYEPLATVSRLHGFDRFLALPFVALLEMAWRWGMVRQLLMRRGGETH
jgi:GT2 family glycosyltransferase